MVTFLIGLGSVLALLLSLFIILVILMQKPSANAGMGSTLAGGAAENAFGAETSNIFSRWTAYGMALFFILALVLYVTKLSIYHQDVGNDNQERLPTIVDQVSVTPGTLTQEKNTLPSLESVAQDNKK